MAECPTCHTSNRDGAKFCIGCGHSLAASDSAAFQRSDKIVSATASEPATQPCQQCAAPLSISSRFCKHCGAAQLPAAPLAQPKEQDRVPADAIASSTPPAQPTTSSATSPAGETAHLAVGTPLAAAIAVEEGSVAAVAPPPRPAPTPAQAASPLTATVPIVPAPAEAAAPVSRQDTAPVSADMTAASEPDAESCTAPRVAVATPAVTEMPTPTIDSDVQSDVTADVVATAKPATPSSDPVPAKAQADCAGRNDTRRAGGKKRIWLLGSGGAIAVATAIGAAWYLMSPAETTPTSIKPADAKTRSAAPAPETLQPGGTNPWHKPEPARASPAPAPNLLPPPAVTEPAPASSAAKPPKSATPVVAKEPVPAAENPGGKVEERPKKTESKAKAASKAQQNEHQKVKSKLEELKQQMGVN